MIKKMKAPFKSLLDRGFFNKKIGNYEKKAKISSSLDRFMK